MAVSSSSWTSSVTDASLYQSTATTSTQSELDKNAFLSLLITQMQYQDPLDPVDDKEFLAQMAQFSALEQMQNLNTSTEEIKASSAVGKYAISTSYNDVSGEYETIEGRVEGYKMENGEAYVMIGEEEVALSAVTEIYDDYTELSKLASLEQAMSISQNLALIGKNVEYNEYDSDGNVTGTKQGTVEYVKFVSDGVVLRINGEDIYASAITRVSDSEFTDTTTDTETDTETDDTTETEATE